VLFENNSFNIEPSGTEARRRQQAIGSGAARDASPTWPVKAALKALSTIMAKEVAAPAHRPAILGWRRSIVGMTTPRRMAPAAHCGRKKHRRGSPEMVTMPIELPRGELGFADSPLEESGFELLVPLVEWVSLGETGRK
jgi:hypothetical protein